MSLNIIYNGNECNAIKYNTHAKYNSELKVLVILPTLNRPKKCKNVIEHIMKQTHKNTDLIVIDDGSTDANYEILRKHIDNIDNKKIILKRNDANMKIAKTLNVGLKYFLDNNYDYLSWVSDDNEYYDNYIYDLISLNSDFAYTAYDYNNILNNTIKKHNIKYVNYDNLLMNFQGIMAFIWSLNAIKLVGFYDETLYGSEDFDYIVRTFLQKNITYGYSNVQTMSYNRDENSLYYREKERINKEFNMLKNKYKNLY